MTTTAVTAKQRLDEAMRDYIAEITDGTYLTEYFLVAASTDVADMGTSRTIYVTVTAQDQPPHVSLGLLAYANVGRVAAD